LDIATITGNVFFGTGDNQIINIFGGNSTTLLASMVGNVTYGQGTMPGSDQLTVGAFGVFAGSITAPSGVAVDVQPNGLLNLENAQTSTAGTSATALNATTFKVENQGTVTLFVSEALTGSGVIQASQSATIAQGADLGVAYASFVPQVSSGSSDQFVLITAPHTGCGSGGTQSCLYIDPATIDLYNTSLTHNVSDTVDHGALPFLFKSAQLGTDTLGNTDRLVLNIVPKTKDELGLTPGSYGYQLFDQVNQALGIDETLGSAMVNGVRNLSQAQAAYNSFAPNVTGGSRAIAISITDPATGVVAARQRSLTMYSQNSGEETLWGQQFVQMIKDPGRGATDANTGDKIEAGFKDHGFGFAIGMDSGSPRYGWYGGAFTFYAGDVGELARDSHTNEEWYLLSGYSVWRGKGLFFDSKVDVGYGHFNGKRYVTLEVPTTGGTNTYTREADNTHAGALLSGGFTTGAMLAYGATTFTPELSLDGLLMREEGYTEKNPGAATLGDGFDLQVQPYYAKSLRAFIGADVRHDIDLGDFFLQPEMRVGYRYDFLNDPVKLKAAFAYADTTGATAAAGQQFTVTGPDPAQGNFVLGGSIAATTDAWSLGGSYDFVRGSNGAFEQVGMINLLGRI